MSPAALEEKIARVSPPYRQELIDFIDFILYRQDHDGKPSGEATGKKKRVSNFGALRDAITYIAPDFDEPLDCFKEYT